MKVIITAFVFSLVTLQAFALSLLTVTVNSEVANYSLDDLETMPQVTFITTNAFVDGPVEFSGPLLRDVLERSDLLDIENVQVTALNDYSIEFPVSDALDFDVIIATRMDGELISVRDKGPLWIMYPVTGNPELEDPIYKSRMIWQLKEILAE